MVVLLLFSIYVCVCVCVCVYIYIYSMYVYILDFLYIKILIFLACSFIVLKNRKLSLRGKKQENMSEIKKNGFVNRIREQVFEEHSLVASNCFDLFLRIQKVMIQI